MRNPGYSRSLDKASACRGGHRVDAVRHFRQVASVPHTVAGDGISGAIALTLQESLRNAPRRKRRQVDGRRLRSERTRHLIIEAYLDLLKLAPGTPTAAQIAARAGYSVRSIFERFSDLDALGLAAMDYALAVGQARPGVTIAATGSSSTVAIAAGGATLERRLPFGCPLGRSKVESLALTPDTSPSSKPARRWFRLRRYPIHASCLPRCHRLRLGTGPPLV